MIGGAVPFLQLHHGRVVDAPRGFPQGVSVVSGSDHHPSECGWMPVALETSGRERQGGLWQRIAAALYSSHRGSRKKPGTTSPAGSCPARVGKTSGSAERESCWFELLSLENYDRQSLREECWDSSAPFRLPPRSAIDMALPCSSVAGTCNSLISIDQLAAIQLQLELPIL